MKEHQHHLNHQCVEHFVLENRKTSEVYCSKYLRGGHWVKGAVMSFQTKDAAEKYAHAVNKNEHDGDELWSARPKRVTT